LDKEVRDIKIIMPNPAYEFSNVMGHLFSNQIKGSMIFDIEV